MKNSIPFAYAAIILSGFLNTQGVRAEDLLVLQSKKEVRCTVKEFAGGFFTCEDESGKSFKIGPSALLKIKFDVPEQSSSTATNSVTKAPTIEQVNTFPEKFVGQTVSFQGCSIDQKLERVKGSTYFALSVTSKGGQYITPIIRSDGITFIVPQNIAETMAAKIAGGYSWTSCSIKCKIEKMNLEATEATVALVSCIEVFTSGGKVGTTFGE
jgi:hypothetical protein